MRSVLPNFVTCVEHIVTDRCGRTPLNVLRAISSTDVCPVTMESKSEQEFANVCTNDLKRLHTQCVGNFYRDFKMLPIALLNDPTNVYKVKICILKKKKIQINFLIKFDNTIEKKEMK